MVVHAGCAIRERDTIDSPSHLLQAASRFPKIENRFNPAGMGKSSEIRKSGQGHFVLRCGIRREGARTRSFPGFPIRVARASPATITNNTIPAGSVSSMD